MKKNKAHKQSHSDITTITAQNKKCTYKSWFSSSDCSFWKLFLTALSMLSLFFSYSLFKTVLKTKTNSMNTERSLKSGYFDKSCLRFCVSHLDCHHCLRDRRGRLAGCQLASRRPSERSSWESCQEPSQSWGCYHGLPLQSAIST